MLSSTLSLFNMYTESWFYIISLALLFVGVIFRIVELLTNHIANDLTVLSSYWINRLFEQYSNYVD